MASKSPEEELADAVKEHGAYSQQAQDALDQYLADTKNDSSPSNKLKST